MIVTSLFWKLTKISTNNLEADVKGTSGRLKMCRNIITVSANPSLSTRNFMPCCTTSTTGHYLKVGYSDLRTKVLQKH